MEQLAPSDAAVKAMAETLAMPDGTLFTITRPAEASGGEVIEMEITLPPGAPSPPRHIHPRQEERWETLSGTLTVYAGGRWRELPAGESVTIPAGDPHTLRNATKETVRVRDIHRPALDFEDYIRKLHTLAKSGKITSPRRPSTLIYFSMLWREQNTQVAADLPLRVAMTVLGAVGRLLRYRTS